jgi:hypothetical protein
MSAVEDGLRNERTEIERRVCIQLALLWRRARPVLASALPSVALKHRNQLLGQGPGAAGGLVRGPNGRDAALPACLGLPAVQLGVELGWCTTVQLGVGGQGLEGRGALGPLRRAARARRAALAVRATRSRRAALLLLGGALVRGRGRLLQLRRLLRRRPLILPPGKRAVQPARASLPAPLAEPVPLPLPCHTATLPSTHATPAAHTCTGGQVLGG